jgi:hypothetical protein
MLQAVEPEHLTVRMGFSEKVKKRMGELGIRTSAELAKTAW